MRARVGAMGVCIKVNAHLACGELEVGGCRRKKGTMPTEGSKMILSKKRACRGAESAVAVWMRYQHVRRCAR